MPDDNGVLPPELRRRFAFGTFFFDLPSEEEREAIGAIYEKKFSVSGDRPADDGWTGAEIRQCCDLGYPAGLLAHRGLDVHRPRHLGRVDRIGSRDRGDLSKAIAVDVPAGHVEPAGPILPLVPQPGCPAVWKRITGACRPFLGGRHQGKVAEPSFALWPDWGGKGELGDPAIAASGAAVYRPRRPERTTFYRLLEGHFEEYKTIYEERFEAHDGPWRSCVDKAVQAYLDCGRLHGGFARLRCPACKTEHLLAFSCQTRNLCASCQAKRAALFAERLRQEVLAEVPHRHLIFTIPKALRGLFQRERKLMGLLSRTAYDAVRRLYQAHFERSDVVPGCVASLQTFGSYSANFHPHVHCLVTEGVFTPDRELLPLLFVDVKAIERLFQSLLLQRLHAAERLSEGFIERLEGWRHSGFSVYGEQVVMPDEPERLERLARYLTRPPLPIASVSQADDGRVRVETAPDPRTGSIELLLDPIEWVHRICLQIPDPRYHLTRSYGAYANKARRLRLPGCERPPAASIEDEESDFVKARKASWARLIRRIYEVDPLLCPRCGTVMDLLAVITEPLVIDRILRHRKEAGIPDPFALLPGSTTGNLTGQHHG